MIEQQRDDIVDRINRLEQSNRWWMGLTVAFASSFIILLVIAICYVSSSQQAKGQAQVHVKDEQRNPIDSNIHQNAYYTNFCHVRFLPEELVLDFGLNVNVENPPNESLPGSNRVVMNFYTAKRLRNGLDFAIQRYEDAFGPLELDFKKRNTDQKK